MFAIDNFFTQDQFSVLRAFADEQSFVDFVNPVDDAVYPGIYPHLPDQVQFWVLDALEKLYQGSAVDIQYAFMRLSVEGAKPPQIVHTDVSMADNTLIVYLNREEHCQGGTAIMEHETGIITTARTDEDLETVLRDSDDVNKWDVVASCEMVPNRAFICDSDLFHMAEPVGGFGTGVYDGRLVLVCFFNLERLN